mmetsp:Transcript_35665/g.101667  ORF Transcript_35665/g.101667 Transcript_35665/m.101667 type:complete len:212 (-) Transcript_35665:275-910(-)
MLGRASASLVSISPTRPAISASWSTRCSNSSSLEMSSVETTCRRLWSAARPLKSSSVSHSLNVSGIRPAKSWNATRPADHTSHLLGSGSFLKSSGARYIGWPTARRGSASATGQASPKPPTLRWQPSAEVQSPKSKRLLGWTLRWTHPRLSNLLRPRKSSTSMRNRTSSETTRGWSRCANTAVDTVLSAASINKLTAGPPSLMGASSARAP